MKYSHYYKTLPCLTVDVYRVLHAFDVTDPCLQHAAKKIMCAGGRGAKDAKKDIEEAIDSLVRWLEMRREESGENMQGNDLKVSICDSLNLADSFLYDMRQTELSWNEHHEARMDVIGQNGPTGEHYDNEKEQRIDAAIENLSKFADQDDGWIQNKDEVQPVPNKCKVDVRFASGVVGKGAFAGSLYWGLCDGGASIVAYRIRNEIYNDDEEAQV